MRTAFLVATRRCTRDCPFCFYATGYLRHPSVELETPRIIEAVGRAAELGATKLIVSGGEPLLRPDLGQILEKAGACGMTRLLLTNGDPLDERTVRRVAQAGLEAVSLSVNDTATLPRRAAAVALLAREAAVPVTAIIAFHRRNANEIPAILDWAARSGVAALLQPAFIPPGSAGERSLSPRRLSPDEWAVVEPAVRRWASASGAEPYARLVLGLYGRGEPLKPRRCAMGSGAFVIDCDGSVYPCFHRRELAAGGILSSDAAELETRLAAAAEAVAEAPCFGERCVSLFAGVEGIDLAPAR